MSETPKPRGRASDWSDEDIDAMLTPQALMRAQPEAAETWEEDAPSYLDGLPGAKELLDDAGTV